MNPTSAADTMSILPKDNSGFNTSINIITTAIAVAAITLVGSLLVVTSPALPAIISIISIIKNPWVGIPLTLNPISLFIFFYALPKILAINVFTASFMIPFGITVAASIGTAVLIGAIGVVIFKIAESKDPKTISKSISEIVVGVIFVNVISVFLKCFCNKGES